MADLQILLVPSRLHFLYCWSCRSEYHKLFQSRISSAQYHEPQAVDWNSTDRGLRLSKKSKIYILVYFIKTDQNTIINMISPRRKVRWWCSVERECVHDISWQSNSLTVFCSFNWYCKCQLQNAKFQEIKIHNHGKINMWTKFHGNPSHSYYAMSVSSNRPISK